MKISLYSLCVLCAAVAHGGNPQDRAALPLRLVIKNYFSDTNQIGMLCDVRSLFAPRLAQ
jgi:hypothetical protein